MLQTSEQIGKPKLNGWGLGVAIAALVAVLATGLWAGYRLLDPVTAMDGSSTTCFSTGFPDSTAGAITTPALWVKPGRRLKVERIELIKPQNFELIGSGIQDRVDGIGVEHYPEPTGSTDDWLAWENRALLPAWMEGGTRATPIIAVKPIIVGTEASSPGVRYVYRNRWNVKYSIDQPFGVEAKPNCLLEDEDEEQ